MSADLWTGIELGPFTTRALVCVPTSFRRGLSGITAGCVDLRFTIHGPRSTNSNPCRRNLILPVAASAPRLQPKAVSGFTDRLISFDGQVQHRIGRLNREAAVRKVRLSPAILQSFPNRQLKRRALVVRLRRVKELGHDVARLGYVPTNPRSTSRLDPKNLPNAHRLPNTSANRAPTALTIPKAQLPGKRRFDRSPVQANRHLAPGNLVGELHLGGRRRQQRIKPEGNSDGKLAHFSIIGPGSGEPSEPNDLFSLRRTDHVGGFVDRDFGLSRQAPRGIG